MQRIRRALTDLRRGEPVHVDNGSASVIILALEMFQPSVLPTLDGMTRNPPRLVLRDHRARAVGLDAGDDHDLAFPCHDPGWLADPVGLGLGDELPDALADSAESALTAERAGLALARSGGLLPALVSLPVDTGNDLLEAAINEMEILSVTPRAVADFTRMAHEPPVRVSEAQVPLEPSESARFVVYREADGLHEHVAVLIGDPAQWPAAPALRLHSACLTGDLFGSLRCDCGEQLRNAVAMIREDGGGVLLYLAQEGRGIGLANKLRAYGLQDTGLDTVDADQRLGFGPDERRYESAAAILRDLGLTRIRLVTNNPEKIAALEAAGIGIEGRSAVHGLVNPHNKRYLTAKADRAGHWLDAAITDSASR
jgi:GTP cyclohydrolase II